MLAGWLQVTVELNPGSGTEFKVIPICVVLICLVRTVHHGAHGASTQKRASCMQKQITSISKGAAMENNAGALTLRCLLTRMALVVTTLVIGAGLFACDRTEPKPAGPPEKITIAYATLLEAALAQVAQTRDYYRAEGLEAAARLHPYGKLALEELLAGKADFATVAETPVMFAIMKGEKIAIIATIHDSGVSHAIMARKDRGILVPGDLKGKRIAATLGTTSDFFLDALLGINRIAREDVEIVNIEAQEIPDALTRGDIDAVSAFNPYKAWGQKKWGDRVVTFEDKDIYRLTFNVVATQEFIRNNPDTVKKMLRALVKAEESVRRNPAEAQQIASDFNRIEIDMVRDLWSGINFNVTLDQSLILALEDESRWAINSGLTEAKKVPNYLDYIYIDGLKSVKPDAIRILK
jgi:NitT/TauT family transport system substrate-binding protein